MMGYGLVRLEAFGGEQIVRRVVEIQDDVILVCRDEELRRAQEQGRPPLVVGFRLDAVVEMLPEAEEPDGRSGPAIETGA